MILRAKSLCRFLPAAATLCTLLGLSGVVKAQMGVAPSQTGMFFNDIRVRADQAREGMSARNAAAGPTTGTEGVYLFDENGQYTGQPIDQRSLGTPFGVDSVTRQVGVPSPTGPGPSGSSRRLAGDNSGYNGRYAATSSFFAPTYVSDPFLAGRRNVKLGPVNIGLGLTGAVEYNDNVLRGSSVRGGVGIPAARTANGTLNQALSEPISDYIGSAYLNMDLNYPITEHNRLTLTAGIGISQYFNHPELSGNGNGIDYTILPGTALALDVKVGKVIFVLYDRMSIQPANQDNFTLDDSDIFGVFQNDAGIAMNWAINSQLNLTVNFNRSDTLALQERFDRYDRTVNSLSASLAWTPSGTWTVGLEGGYSWIDYKQDFNNDGTTANAGVFVVLPLSKSTLVRVAGGYQTFDFDTPPLFARTVSDQDITGTQTSITNLNTQIAALNIKSSDPVQAQASQQQLATLQNQLTQAQNTLTQQTAQKTKEDTTFNSRSFDRTNKSNDYYYNVGISNQLNARVAQQLSFGHESSLNNTSNLVTADYVTYGLGIIAWRGARIAFSAFYEKSNESGGNLKEDITQYGGQVNLIHSLGENLTGGVGFLYGVTDSDLALRDYVQYAITVDLNYRLNTKWNIGLGYQYWKTTADDDTQSFTQNRIILSTNYNF